MNEFMKGSLTIDLSQRISDCGEVIDENILEEECLDSLTDEQRNAISNIVHMAMLSKFDDFKLDIYAEEFGNE